MISKPEVWLRGPLPKIPDLLQPVAHALLQAREELDEMLVDFPNEKLWDKFYGMTSPAFHLQHLTGVLDRLFTYAKGDSLSEEQLIYLKNEGIENSSLNSEILLENFRNQVDNALMQLESVNPGTLKEIRFVGRAKIETTQIGLYIHAAEHTMRHIGQLLVTIKILRATNL